MIKHTPWTKPPQQASISTPQGGSWCYHSHNPKVVETQEELKVASHGPHSWPCPSENPIPYAGIHSWCFQWKLIKGIWRFICGDTWRIIPWSPVSCWTHNTEWPLISKPCIRQDWRDMISIFSSVSRILEISIMKTNSTLHILTPKSGQFLPSITWPL